MADAAPPNGRIPGNPGQRLPPVDPRNILARLEAWFTFRRVIYIFIGLWASSVCFTRTLYCPQKDLHLEVLLHAFSYYLEYASVRETAEIVIVGHFTWFVAFSSKSQRIYHFLMMPLHVICAGMYGYTFTNAGFILIREAVAYLFHVEYPAIMYTQMYVAGTITTLIVSLYKQRWRCFPEDIFLATLLLGPATIYAINSNVQFCMPELGAMGMAMFLVAKLYR